VVEQVDLQLFVVVEWVEVEQVVIELLSLAEQN
jgi:hypothetical protein